MGRRIEVRVRVLFVLLVAAALVVVAPAMAVAAPPGNDAFAAAEEVTGDLPLLVPGTNVDATIEADEPTHAAAGGASVWFRWTVPADGFYAADTCIRDFDTLLAVYRGTDLATLELVASNDDTCATGSQVEFEATAGDELHIAVDGFGGSQGTFSLLIAAGEPPPPPPANDDFADATVLAGDLPIATSGDSSNATHEPGEPDHPNTEPPGHSVWFRWTPPVSEPVAIETCLPPQTPGFFTTLSVYTGSDLASLELIESDAGECTVFSTLTVNAVAGTMYHIALDSYLSFPAGQYTLTIRRGPPANDHLDSPQVLDGPLPITAEGTTVDATWELREPDPPEFSPGYPTVWYAWTPTETADVLVETCGSATLTTSIVTTATSWDEWDPALITGEHARCGGQDSIALHAVAGTSYRIRVGTPTAEGAIRVTIRPGSFTRPPNDDFAAARVIGPALPATAYGSSVNASAQPGEPDHGGVPAENTIWYRWTAPRTQTVEIDTCGSEVAMQLAVYTGSSIDVLTPVPGVVEERCFGQNLLPFAAVAGRTYRIAVWRGSSEGSVRLHIRVPSRPSNDAFTAARRLPGGPVTVSASNVDATHEPGEPPDYASGGLGTSIWYRWTPDRTGDVVIETCGSEFTALLGIWTGPSVDALEQAPGQRIGWCTREYGADSAHGEDVTITFRAIAGTTYHLSVDGSWGNPTRDQRENAGDIRLRIRPPRPPANDDLAGATVLSGRLPFTVRSSNVDSTHEATDPEIFNDSGSYTPSTSVWYRYTSPRTESIVFTTCAPGSHISPTAFTRDEAGELVLVPDPISHDRSLENVEGCDKAGRARVEAVAGTTYWLMLEGYGYSGPFQLTVRPTERPRNDDFTTPTELGNRLPIELTVNNVDASSETDEFGPIPFWAIWYRWTAPRTQQVTVETCGAEWDTQIAVGTGSTLESLDVVDFNDDWCVNHDPNFPAVASSVRFDAVAGTTYRIAVGTFFTERGPMPLRIRATSPPRGDSFAGAIPIRSTVTTATNVDSSAQPGEPSHGSSRNRTIWFRWTAKRSATASFSTCGSGIGTTVGVYTGTSVASLGGVTQAGSTGVCTEQSLAVWEAVAGTTYSIAVAGDTSALGPAVEGPVKVTLLCDAVACA